MEKTTTSKGLTFIGAAIKEGQNLNGVEKAPAAIRQSGLFQSLKSKFSVETEDEGDVSVKNLSREDLATSQKVEHHVENLHLLSPVLKQLSDKVESACKKNPGNITLTVGGDHSIATGSIHGLRMVHPNLKVIWVDAHPDFIDIKQSQYPGYHGIPLAHLTGVSKFENFSWMKSYLPMENFVLIGIRDIDEDEWKSLKKHNVKCFTMDHVDMLGIGEVMRQAIQYLDPKGDSPFHISFDVDGIDPNLVQATGTKFRGGLSHRESCHIIRRTAHERKLVGLDIVEINEELVSGKEREAFRGEDHLHGVSETVGVAIDLIESVFTQYLTL